MWPDPSHSSPNTPLGGPSILCSWHRVTRTPSTFCPLHHGWGMGALCPSGPSCLGVGAVGEVGDTGAVREDLLGRCGHAQDGHLLQLQASPLAGHMYQLIHDRVLGRAERDEKTENVEVSADSWGRDTHENRDSSWLQGNDLPLCR